jgi:hypothetical protein
LAAVLGLLTGDLEADLDLEATGLFVEVAIKLRYHSCIASRLRGIQTLREDSKVEDGCSLWAKP